MALRSGYYGLKKSLLNKVKGMPGIKSIGSGLSLNSTTGELTATGTTVAIEANPEGAATDNLVKLGIGEDIYAVPDAAKTYQTDDATESVIVDADYVPFLDSSAASGAGAPKKSTWSNFKAKLKAVFDALYMSWSAYVLTGASNLFKNQGTTTSSNNVTFTVNSDGSVTITTTSEGASAQTQFNLCNYIANKYKGLSATMGIVGSLSSAYLDIIYSNDGTAYATEDGIIDIKNKAISSYYNYIKLAIIVPSGVILSEPLTVYPMITVDDSVSEFAPFAMTNRELTEEAKLTPTSDGTIITEITDNDSVVIVGHKIAILNLTVKVGTFADWTTALSGLPKPAHDVLVCVVNRDNPGQPVFGNLFNNGILQFYKGGSSATPPATNEKLTISAVYQYASLT